MTRRRTRRRKRSGVRRRVLLLAAATAIPSGLIVSVRRSSEGARLDESLNELRTEERLLQEQLSVEISRVDSLSSLRRIVEAVRALDLREPADHEVLHVVDVAAPDGGQGG